jgi:hypothetical protein
MSLIDTVTDFFDPTGSKNWFETLQKRNSEGFRLPFWEGKAPLAVKLPSMSTRIVINRGLRI